MSSKRSASTELRGTSSTVVYQAPPSAANFNTPPPLKLRIKHQSLAQKLTVDIYEAKTSKDILVNLLKFSRQLKLSQIHSEECEYIIRFLKELIKKESDILIKSKCIEIMGEICLIPHANKHQIIEDIVDALHKEVNHNYLSCIFKTLSLTATLLTIKADVIQKILKAAIKRLDDSHQDVRCACLNLIGRICPNEPIKISSGRIVDTLELFNEFSADQDPRVREVVYQALLTLHQRGNSLDLSVYDKACGALNDDYQNVRVAAVKLIWVFSHIFPERMIGHPYNRSDQIRLLDDAFIKICNMVNDSSFKVRAQAVGLMASLHDVSFHLLEQTLDKKLMSKGKRAKSFSERQLERFRGGVTTSGQWSTGKTWGDNDPKDMKENEIKVTNTGSFGVFVRALEDEYMEVRTAGVDSLCELANQNPVFAHMSTDFLVDMFNDEIEAVRLNSINSLVKLHQYVDLREDQLDTVLESLNDFNMVIRNSVRQLLAHCTLSTQACLYATVLALLGNFKKYPQDCKSIWRCLKELGTNHPYFVSALVPNLLVTHHFYDVPEPSIDDVAHIGVAVLIFNASVKCKSIWSILPSYARQHYDYLHDSLPRLIPTINQTNSIDENKRTTGEEISSVETFFNATVDRIEATLSNQPSHQSLATCVNDLTHVRNMHPSYAPAAEFLLLYLQCQKLLIQCRQDRNWQIPSALATNDSSALCNNARELAKLSYKLEYAFCGQTCQSIITLKSIRILAHCLSILLELRQLTRGQHTKKVDLKLWEPLLTRLNGFKDHIKSTLTLNDQVKIIIDLQENIEEHLSEPSRLIDLLQNFFLSYDIQLLVKNRLRQSRVKVIEPRNNIDNPIRFTSGLTHAINVDIWLENIENISEIYVKIVYPDLTVQIHKPKATEFLSISSSKHHLVTKVILTHQTWTEPCNMKFTIVQGHTTDVRDEFYSSKEINTNHSGIDRNVRTAVEYMDGYKGYIELSDIINIYIQPKPIGR